MLLLLFTQLSNFVLLKPLLSFFIIELFHKKLALKQFP